MYEYLGLFVKEDVGKPEVIDLLHQACAAIIEKEGGASKSERAKKANALDLLLRGYQDNKERLDPTKNNTYSMEEFNFSNLSEAATYARRGSNSAVLTKVEYYCHHPLLQDGNVLVDMPGIDAPVKKRCGPRVAVRRKGTRTKTMQNLPTTKSNIPTPRQ